MTSIQQGDQYNLPIKICMGCEAYATPENVDDVRIKVGNILKEYSKGEITFSDDNWNYPLTEEQTKAVISGVISVQVAIKVGNDIILSATQTIPVGSSIIQENW